MCPYESEPQRRPRCARRRARDSRAAPAESPNKFHCILRHIVLATAMPDAQSERPPAAAGRLDAKPSPGSSAPSPSPGAARRRAGCGRARRGSPPSRPRGACRRRSVISESASAQRLELADDAVAAAPAPGAAAAASQRVARYAQRELELERLDRRVEGVAHRHVDAARAVGVGAGALSAAERLVVGERLVAEREVVHRALARGRAPAEGAEHEVGDPAGGLDVARRDGGRRRALSRRAQPARAPRSAGRRRREGGMSGSVSTRTAKKQAER